MALDGATVTAMYGCMVRIRAFEERVNIEFLHGRIPGFVHLYAGEEAVAAGVMSALRPDDYITSTHRGHGHCIAKGADMKRMMAEIYGKKTGYCKGKGGSMHIADVTLGILGANGIVGAGMPIAAGAAFACKYKGTDRVAAAFFGDGASNCGTFHEALNLGAAWRLPALFVCENNEYGLSCPREAAMNIDNIADRACGYGIPGVVVDGNDVVAVRETTEALLKEMREGGGPALLECKTWRQHGHYVGDPQTTRDSKRCKEWLTKDPIPRCAELLVSNGWASQADLESIQAEADAEVEAAVQYAESSEHPSPSELTTDVYAG